MVMDNPSDRPGVRDPCANDGANVAALQQLARAIAGPETGGGSPSARSDGRR
jgi:hypothetical protein